MVCDKIYKAISTYIDKLSISRSISIFDYDKLMKQLTEITKKINVDEYAKYKDLINFISLFESRASLINIIYDKIKDIEIITLMKDKFIKQLSEIRILINGQITEWKREVSKLQSRLFILAKSDQITPAMIDESLTNTPNILPTYVKLMSMFVSRFPDKTWKLIEKRKNEQFCGKKIKTLFRENYPLRKMLLFPNGPICDLSDKIANCKNIVLLQNYNNTVDYDSHCIFHEKMNSLAGIDNKFIDSYEIVKEFKPIISKNNIVFDIINVNDSAQSDIKKTYIEVLGENKHRYLKQLSKIIPVTSGDIELSSVRIDGLTTRCVESLISKMDFSAPDPSYLTEFPVKIIKNKILRKSIIFISNNKITNLEAVEQKINEIFYNTFMTEYSKHAKKMNNNEFLVGMGELYSTSYIFSRKLHTDIVQKMLNEYKKDPNKKISVAWKRIVLKEIVVNVVMKL